MTKKNLTPFILLFFMIVSIVLAIIFKYWLFIFFAAEMIIFHLTPPFAVILSVIAYKNHLSFWFNQFSWEKKLYRKLKVKSWKTKFPTYDEKMFSLDTNSKEDIIKIMIQSENVHLILFFTSFLPVILGKYYGHYPIIITMALFFAISHLPFVIIQRFNLPRVSSFYTKKAAR